MEQKPFADLFVDVTKRAVKIQKKDYLPMGRYPIIDQGQEWCAGFTNEEKGLYRDVPAYIFGDHTRVIKYVDKPFYLGADGVKLLKLREGIQASPRFFYYALKSQRIPDTGYNRHFKWLKESLYHVPTLDEQTHIADILDTLSMLITLCEKKIFLFNELVKSQFVELFGDSKNPLFSVSTIGDECILKSGTTLSTDMETDDGAIPYIKVSDMNLPQNSIYINTSTRYVSRKNAGNTFLQKGSVIFPKRGAAIATNKKRILVHDTCCDLNIMGVLPKDNIRTTYLYSYFMSMDLGSLYNGSTVPQLNNKDISPLKISVPPMELQIEFERLFEQVDKSKLVLRQLLEKQKTLKAALMQEYFS